MLAQTAFSIDDIPGGRAAVNVIVGKVAEFNRLPSRLANVTNLLNVVVTQATARRDTLTRDAALLLLQGAQQIQSDYAGASALVADVMDTMRRTGLAQGVTLDFVLSVGQAGSEVLSLLSRTATLEKDAGDLAAGAGVHPSVISRVTQAGVVKYLVYGGLGYLALKLFRVF